jgi:hypothetical protein
MSNDVPVPFDQTDASFRCREAIEKISEFVTPGFVIFGVFVIGSGEVIAASPFDFPRVLSGRFQVSIEELD